jgi:sulfite reductase (NADPH) flavoprotein alpha-component
MDYERIRYISPYKTAGVRALNAEEIGAQFLAQKPNASIRFFYATNLKDDLKHIAIYAVENEQYGYYEINPYSGEIITDGAKSVKFFTAVMTLHRFLSFEGMSAIGKHIVAATAVAIIVLSISGILLYLPRLKRDLFKSLRIELKSKGYKFWYQLHSVIGVFTLVFVLIMCLTGLWWSYEWYRNFLNQLAGVESVAYALNEDKEMASGDPRELQKTIDAAKDMINNCAAYYIRVPFKNEPYELSYSNVRYGAYNILKIDAQNGAIISQELYKDKTIGQKLIQNIYALHSGQFFGEIGKALWCVSSLSMALFGISGAIMFYKRTKRKRSAAKAQSVERAATLASLREGAKNEYN